MSPRSGTPVKLLGREDASVDWYNLEKSKRVKAFRCGEFDACIERAEASQGIPIKKREKYARREDAILHALELEKQQLEMPHLKHGTVSNGIGSRSSGSQRRELSRFSASIYARDDDPGVHTRSPNHKSLLFSRKEILSREEEYVHRVKPNKQLGWEDENSETFPRMRELQDFGLRTAPPKKKLSQMVTWEASRKPLDIHLDGHSSLGHMSRGASHRSSLAVKRKKTQNIDGEDTLVKKRDRRRPLVQVLQSSAKLPVSHSFQSEFDTGNILVQGEQDQGGAIRAKRSRCVYLPTDSIDSMDNIGYPYEEMPSIGTQFGTGNSLYYPGSLAEKSSSSSELAEETESDSSETDYLEPDMEEDGKLMAGATRGLVPVFRDGGSPAAQASEDFTDLKTDEMPLPGYIPSLRPQDQLMDASTDAGVSKWNLKGKRNIRNLTKRPLYLMDGKISSIRGDVHENRDSSFKMRQPVVSNPKTSGRGFYIKKESSYDAPDGLDMIEKDSGRNQLMVYNNRRYPFPLHGVKDRGRSHSSFNDFNDSDNDSHMLSPSRPYWEEPEERFDLDYADHLGDELDSMWIDVDIKVQNPSHQGEHVPFVSLMSRFNGKQILGHPVQIEILEDGSSSNLVSKYSMGFDEASAPPAFGRTAKRTVMHRIPRAHPAASAFDDDDAYLSDSDQETKPSPRKLYGGYFNHQTRLSKKSISQVRRPSAPSKFQKKQLKRVNMSSQKTRTLSSLASGSLRLNRRSDILDGLIKPEGSIPLVTCVPVKVVFSRILESIGRPSSVSAHRARMSSPAVRGLS